ncbi:nitroreductase family protein [Saccharopolyspora sp. NFXS83]|uniref:Acg family FMN-binding oxidoreductase n=1 Tax=Saccharopolyspora sp. NFXS83 TaxID=2993560 RepID=UPI00224B361A|nr:nitroreductase family protein [Saccharopolyspora sp. NFXS83]MCX2729382.1 nitroreductase family protein [Saccharopolyspora sp. NFXS83]
MLSEAVAAAPSVHNAQPWTLVVRGHVAELHPRQVDLLDEHDPQGRDRAISFGAALTNLLVAVRHLGRLPHVDRAAAPESEPATAKITATREATPSGVDERRFAAIERRRSYRGAFAEQPVTDAERDTLRVAAGLGPDEMHWITGSTEASEVARSLAYAARVLHADAEYQRELTHWIVQQDATGDPTPGAGIPEKALGRQGLPAVGLVTGQTKLPDESLLASRIEHDSVLVLCSATDSTIDHVRIGEALQSAWLEATAGGLAVSVMTQPLRLEEMRKAVTEQLGLAGVPHAFLRFGRTA